MFADTVRQTAASKVALIAITAALYAVAKGLTAFIPTPFGVGQFLLFIFVPAFFAITGDTLSAAIGAGIGTFLGDTIKTADPARSRAVIYRLDWEKAWKDGNLDAAIVSTIDDDAAVNGCRPEFVEINGRTFLATADYGDIRPEIRL